MQAAQFIHLHCNSEYSITSGILRLQEMTARTKELGMPAVALTDHSNLFGMVKFYKSAIAEGIKPIIGADVIIGDQSGKHSYRLLLLCKNQRGYHNLTELISNAYLERQEHEHPKICVDRLVVKSEGLIAIALPNVYFADQQVIVEWQAIFNQEFYLGISRTGKPLEDQYINNILPIALASQCPVVAINDVCFMHAKDYDAHEARVCINEGVELNDPKREHKYTRQQYFKSVAEMQQLFADLPTALTNTVLIAKKCNLSLSFGEAHLPNYPVPPGMTPEEFLRQEAHHGLNNRFPVWQNNEKKNKYIERLELELKVISEMGFAGYFLIVADFISWALENQVPVGPGRGSGAGSLVAFVLKITNLDPLQYDLLFERFLNPERVSMPDFDIDFCMEGRDRVIDYVANKYGHESVSQIITYGTMAAKAVVRDVGRVLGYPYGFVDKIAKLIPNELGITLEKALQQEEELKNKYKHEDDVKTLINLAKKLEGITRNVGKHAGGVVIAPSKLTDFTPLYCEPGEKQTITQFDKNDVEEIGLVKFDFLGLRTLTIIDWTVKTIEQDIDINKIPLDDTKTFELLCSTKTTAIFQLESRGMKDLIRRLKPDCFEDIVALVALFRPGPLQSGMVDDFIERKHGRAATAYPHPDLEPILKPTYGIILYQEQVMQIAQVLAGYTLGAADLLRRAMGKKKPEEMAKQREIFVSGAIENDVDTDTATYIFDLMEKFAGYGFNKSHSAAYAMVSYQTAWLKAHYPAEFMAAVLSADMSNTDKIVSLIDDCKEFGLKVQNPDINHSIYKFSVADKQNILYGLGAIKGVGENAIESIIATRAQSEFADLFDFCAKIDLSKVTKRTLEALINSGSLDSFHKNRAILMGNLPDAMQAAGQISSNLSHGQDDLFGAVVSNVEYKQFPELSESERLLGEKNSLGLYLTGHPINQYKNQLKHITTSNIADLHVAYGNQKHTIAGFITFMRTRFTKKGDRMAFISIDDGTGRQEVAVFADAYNEYSKFLQKDSLIIVYGEISPDEFTGGLKMRANKIWDIKSALSDFAKRVRLTIEANESLPATFIERLKQAIMPFTPGNCKIFVDYIHSDFKTSLDLGVEWQVKPDNELLDSICSLAPEHISAEICYD